MKSSPKKAMTTKRAEQILSKLIKPSKGMHVYSMWSDGTVVKEREGIGLMVKALAEIDATTPATTGGSIGIVDGVQYIVPQIDPKVFLVALRYAYHYRACSTRAKYEAGASYSVQKNEEQIEEKAVIGWLDNIGYDGRSLHRTIRRARFDRRVFGNAYLEVITNMLGQPVKLRRLDPTITFKKPEAPGGGIVQIKENNFGFTVRHFREFGHENEMEQMGENSVIHWLHDDPLSDVYGMPPIVNAWDALTTMFLISETEHAHYNNKARPEFVVTMEGGVWETDDEDKIHKTFRDVIKGTKNASRTVILQTPNPEAKIQLTPIQAQGFGDEYSETRKIRRAEIMTADDILPSMAGIIENGAIFGGESSSEQLNQFAQDIKFDHEEIEATFNLLIERRTGSNEYSFKISTFGHTVTQMQTQNDRSDVDGGIKTLNDVRRERGLQPYEIEEAEMPLPYALRQQELPVPIEDGNGSPDGNAPVPPAQTVQDTALNGAQTSSLLEIVRAVREGILPKESAIRVITVAFPTIDEKEAANIVEPIEISEVKQ